MRRFHAVGAVVASCALLGGCSSDSPASPERSLSDAPATEPSATPVIGDVPRVGECRVLTRADIPPPTNDDPVVPCAKLHTAVTFHVGHWPESVVDAVERVDSDRLQGIVGKACDTAWARTVGGDREAREMTVLSWAWFKPTQAHDEAGARWFRCDLVTDTTPLRPLPVHADGLLSSGRVGDRWALCSRGHPGRGGNNVSCAQPHRYRLAGILRFASHRGADYPGIKAIKRRGSDRCSDTIVDLGSYGPTISYVGRTRPGPAGGGAVAADGRVPT